MEGRRRLEAEGRWMREGKRRLEAKGRGGGGSHLLLYHNTTPITTDN